MSPFSLRNLNTYTWAGKESWTYQILPRCHLVCLSLTGTDSSDDTSCCTRITSSSASRAAPSTPSSSACPRRTSACPASSRCRCYQYHCVAKSTKNLGNQPVLLKGALHGIEIGLQEKGWKHTVCNEKNLGWVLKLILAQVFPQIHLYRKWSGLINPRWIR